MGDDLVLEQRLLAQLQYAPLTRAELVRRTGVGNLQVQAALDQLVSGTYVVRRAQDGMPPEYELTPAGAGRLRLVQESFSSPFAAVGKVVVALVQESKRSVRPPWVRTRNRLLLSDADRLQCSDALAEQFGLGRIDKADLDRRTDLLYAAKTRDELVTVFDGLPEPVLDKPRPRPARVRLIMLVIAIVLSLPFLVLGAAMVSSPPNVATFLVGLVCFVGALAWDYLVWFWATRATR